MSPLFKDFSQLHILAEESGPAEMFEKILDTMIWKADREYERRVSSSSPDTPSVFDDDEKGPPLVVERFDTLPRYVGKRPAIIDDIFPTNFPTSLYGEGGIAKSIVGLYKLIRISAGMGSCFGFRIQDQVPCLYVDFELDREEQGTRAGKLAAGLGTDIPDNLHYLWAAGHETSDVFAEVRKAIRRFGIRVVCIDSVGLAIEGDTTSGKDVIKFFRHSIGRFQRLGAAVLLIDHQSGLRPGEKYQDKSQYGSVYKGYMSRSRLQLQLDETDTDHITVIMRQNKTNFAAKIAPFKIGIDFKADAISLKREELEEEELRTEQSLNATDRVLLALLDNPAVPDKIRELTNITAVGNIFTKLRKEPAHIEETGVTEGKAKEVQLTDLGRERALKVKNRAHQIIAEPVGVPKEEDEEDQDSSSSPHTPRESGDDDEKPLSYEFVDTPEALERVVQEVVSTSSPVALDTETSSLDVMEARVRLVQLKTEDGPPYVINATAVDVDDLLQALADKHVVVHNAIYDLAVLKKNFGYEHRGPITCTMLTAQVLYGGTNKKAGLQDLLAQNLKVEISKEERDADWFGELSEEMLEYAAGDVMHLHALQEDLAQRIKKSNADLDSTVDLENRMSKVTASMLVSGMPVSEEVLASCIEESRATAEAQLAKLDEFMTDPLPEKFLKANRTNKKVPEERHEKVNWNSPPQITWAFDTIADLQLESTSKDLLAEVEHPLADAVTEYRKALDVYKRFRNTKVTNGRIHAKWNQLKAKTGRMSCENPPLQGIPPSLRKAFVAPKGHKLVVSDLSQIEIRILAVLSGDENLREEFLAGRDVHRSVAAKILGKAQDDVTSEERKLAKSLVFGLLYGMSLYGFATRVKTIYKRDFSEEEIKKKFWDPFFDAYPKVKQWRNKTINGFANGNRVAFTPHGRRRLNLETDRQALNTPIQAGALDVMKSIAVAIYEWRSAAPGPVEIVGLVHDEIIIVTSEKAAEAVAGWMDAIMKEAGEEVANYGVDEDKKVPVEASTAACATWAEKE